MRPTTTSVQRHAAFNHDAADRQPREQGGTAAPLEQQSDLEGTAQHSVPLLLLVLVWYSASVVAIASAKTLLLAAPCPAMLCAAQFTFAAVGTQLLQQPQHQPLHAPETRLVFFLAASYALGFLLTNAAFTFAAPSFVETFKAAEPLSTVGLAAAFLSEWESMATYATLLPIVAGVAIASSSRATFSTAGMALALASNVSFSGRAVLTKALKRRFPTARASASDAHLFYHVSRFGVLLLLPFALLLDMPTLMDVLLLPGGMDANGAAYGEQGGRDNATGIRVPTTAPKAVDTSAAPWTLLAWLAINGTAHATYNGVSFVVLGRVSVATHAVLNIARRIVCIAAASAFFGTPVSLFNWGGVLLSGAGVLAFARSKEQGAGAERRTRALLPLLSSAWSSRTARVGKLREV